jgi:hypothetical protein
MKIIVHIGPPKTGSTSIQKSLAADQAKLSQHGIYYYYRETHMARALTTLYLGNSRGPRARLVKKLGSAQDAITWSENCWQEFEAEVDRRKPDITVISSEFFANVQDVGPLVDRLEKRFDEVYILAYIRDPVDLFVSRTQQRIRGGDRLIKLMTPQSFEYKTRTILTRFAAVVGPERMIVRNFSRDNLVDGDVVADFAAILSRLGSNCTIKSLRANDSVPAAAVAWLLAANDVAANRPKKQRQQGTAKVGQTNKRFMQAEGFKKLSKLRLTDSNLINVIRSETREDCRWINENFLKDQVPLTVLGEKVELSQTTPAQDYEQMRDWILGHVDDQAMVEVMKSLIDTAPRKRGNRRQG